MCQFFASNVRFNINEKRYRFIKRFFRFKEKCRPIALSTRQIQNLKYFLKRIWISKQISNCVKSNFKEIWLMKRFLKITQFLLCSGQNWINIFSLYSCVLSCTLFVFLLGSLSAPSDCIFLRPHFYFFCTFATYAGSLP